jgi:hypothetical protein
MAVTGGTRRIPGPVDRPGTPYGEALPRQGYHQMLAWMRSFGELQRIGIESTGSVDTHKDLHVAAVVDEQDRVIGTRSFATTRPSPLLR